MSFLYLFTFSAPWLPWVILSLGWVLGQDPVDDLIGIGIGLWGGREGGREEEKDFVLDWKSFFFH